MLRPAMAPVLATLIILTGLIVFAWIISSRIRPLLFARKDVRWDDPAERTERLLLYGLGQKRMPSKPERTAGAAHIWIFVAFIVAQLGTLTSFGLAYDPGFHLPLLGHQTWLGQAYLWVKDVIDVLGTAGGGGVPYYRGGRKEGAVRPTWGGGCMPSMKLGALFGAPFFFPPLLPAC